MTHQALSPDTEVTLLLCGRFGGERQDPYQPLSTKEYGELAKWLHVERNQRPATLMTEAGINLLADVHEARIERKRIEFLLGRGTALALAIERWNRGGLWIISRSDPEYPARFKQLLKHSAPPLLYGAGQKSLLNAGGLAMIGSREASASALDFTRAIASQCVNEGMGVVSGGARGVDAAAMQGAIDAGGPCIGVLASDLLKTSMSRQNRMALQEGKLVLVSPFYPEAGFNAGNAMARNRYIYTLADQSLVIDSALNSGGTWEGALENLRHNWVPLFVRMPGEGAGNAELVKRGGLPFMQTANSAESLSELFIRTAAEKTDNAAEDKVLQQSLFAGTNTIPAQPSSLLEAPSISPLDAQENIAPPPVVAVEDQKPVEPVILDLFAEFSARLPLILADGPLSEEEVASALCIEKSQAKSWLKRAVESGLIEKLNKPVRYTMPLQAALC